MLLHLENFFQTGRSILWTYTFFFVENRISDNETLENVPRKSSIPLQETQQENINGHASRTRYTSTGSDNSGDDLKIKKNTGMIIVGDILKMNNNNDSQWWRQIQIFDNRRKDLKSQKLLAC